MASILSVEQLQGLAAGSTPNTITIPSGQTLHSNNVIRAPNQVLQIVQKTNSGTSNNSSPGTWADTTYTISITPQYANSLIELNWSIPFRLNGSSSPIRGGFRCNRTINGASTNTVVNTTSNVEQHQVRNAANEYDDVYSGFHIDTPNTTGVVNYMWQSYIHTDSGAQYAYVFDMNVGGFLILREIAQ